MGRYINCKVNGEWEIVWKYAFGCQPAEMYRIHEELGIGEYHLCGGEYLEEGEESNWGYVEKLVENLEEADGDVLIIQRKELAKMAQCLEQLKENPKTNQDQWYIGMIEAIYQFMVRYPKQEEFIFEGEF